MENRTSDLGLGLGIGSVIGALVYRFSRTSKAKKLKKKVCDAFHKISGQAEEMLDTAKEKVLDTGAAVADKVADKLSRRAVVHLMRRANLLNDALVEHRDAVRQRECLLLIVGDIDGGNAKAALHLL